MNIKMLKATLAGLVLAVSSFANAGLINIENTTSSATSMEALLFNGSTVATYNANNFTIGESFTGMTVTIIEGTGFESFSGTPNSPLSLVSGIASNGIGFLDTFGVFGNAGTGTAANNIGEGLVALLFDFNISNFGLDINGATANSGTTTFAFFNENGGLIENYKHRIYK